MPQVERGVQFEAGRRVGDSAKEGYVPDFQVARRNVVVVRRNERNPIGVIQFRSRSADLEDRVGTEAVVGSVSLEDDDDADEGDDEEDDDEGDDEDDDSDNEEGEDDSDQSNTSADQYDEDAGVGHAHLLSDVSDQAAESQCQGQQPVGIAKDAADFQLLRLRRVEGIVLFVHRDTPENGFRDLGQSWILTEALKPPIARV